MLPRRRLAILLSLLAAAAGIAACGAGDDGPANRGETPSAVGEPGEDASETGGGGAPAEGVEDGNAEN